MLYRTKGTIGNGLWPLPYVAGGLGCCKPPSGSKQSPGWVQGAKPSEHLEILHLTVPKMRPKNHPAYSCTGQKRNSSTSGTYEKGKFGQHVFITLGKLKLHINLQISLHAQGPTPRKSTRDFCCVSNYLICVENHFFSGFSFMLWLLRSCCCCSA